MKIIDETQIRDNDFESALLQAIPAQSATTASYTLSNRVGSKSRSNAQAMQNAAARSQATLHVSITANDENYEREQMEKENRRQKLEQNALPSWHSNSTVGQSILLVNLKTRKTITWVLHHLSKRKESKEKQINSKEIYGSDSKEGTTEQSSVMATPEPQSTVNNNSNFNNVSAIEREAQDALAAYYAQLAEQDADEDDDDDDDEEFDDII